MRKVSANQFSSFPAAAYALIILMVLSVSVASARPVKVKRHRVFIKVSSQEQRRLPSLCQIEAYRIGEIKRHVARASCNKPLRLRKNSYNIRALIEENGKLREKWINRVTIDQDTSLTITFGKPRWLLNVMHDITESNRSASGFDILIVLSGQKTADESKQIIQSLTETFKQGPVAVKVWREYTTGKELTERLKRETYSFKSPVLIMLPEANQLSCETIERLKVHTSQTVRLTSVGDQNRDSACFDEIISIGNIASVENYLQRLKIASLYYRGYVEVFNNNQNIPITSAGLGKKLIIPEGTYTLKAHKRLQTYSVKDLLIDQDTTLAMQGSALTPVQ